MDLRLTPHLNGYPLRFRSPAAQAVVAVLPPIDAACATLRGAPRPAFTLKAPQHHV